MSAAHRVCCRWRETRGARRLNRREPEDSLKSPCRGLRRCLFSGMAIWPTQVSSHSPTALCGLAGASAQVTEPRQCARRVRAGHRAAAGDILRRARRNHGRYRQREHFTRHVLTALRLRGRRSLAPTPPLHDAARRRQRSVRVHSHQPHIDDSGELTRPSYTGLSRVARRRSYLVCSPLGVSESRWNCACAIATIADVSRPLCLPQSQIETVGHETMTRIVAVNLQYSRRPRT